MKKMMMGMVLGVTLVLSLGSGPTCPVDKGHAEVPRVNGIYVFLDNTPLQPYEELGKVGMPNFGCLQYDDMVKTLSRRAKKKYPDADGVIIYGDGERGVPIRFTE